MSSTTQTQTTNTEFGFSVQEGADWSEYLSFRPLYPQSFFGHIFNYHSQKPGVGFETAHDVGAGCGIVSSSLASCFENIIVSDPNEGYTTLARKLLVQDTGISSTRLRFLQEGAEKSSVASDSIDLIAACEMMQWTDTAVAVQEFGRQLKTGGTLALTYYTRPRIVGSEPAQKIWKAIWDEYSKRARGELYDRAFGIINTAYRCIGFPDAEWTDVKRIYISCGGNTEHFKIDERTEQIAANVGDETVWIDNDEDWSDEQDVEWLKGYLATWVPKIPESEIQNLWNDLGTTLKGQRVRIETPVVIVLASRK
ncbi:hypothetical protein ACEQ8H_001340 [Pleosporales sp. CAS-2024a]